MELMSRKKFQERLRKILQKARERQYRQIPWNGMDDGTIKEITKLADEYRETTVEIIKGRI